MATQLFFRDSAADVCMGHNYTLLDGTATRYITANALATSRGSTVRAIQGGTVAGPTNGTEATGWRGSVTGTNCFVTPPLAADVTISGTITANLWAEETDMSSNVAVNVLIQVMRANSFGASGENAVVQIVKSTRITELALSTRAVNNFTTGMTSGYTPVTVNRGDRIRIIIFGDDAGTMAATGTGWTVGFNGATAAADGDSYVTFTENLTFESAPAGTVIYLTDTVSDVATASVDREAWTSRGAGVANDVTNTAAGFTSPIQVTDTAGGTVVDWFTKQLQAVTLAGMAVANIRAAESASTANTNIRVEVARVASDGTGPTVWASWVAAGDELGTSEAAATVNVSGDDLAISDGQRLRIRLYIDDADNTIGSSPAMAASQTVTTYYAGTSAAASGDTYITFPVTLTEFVSSTPGPASSRRQRRASRFLTFR